MSALINQRQQKIFLFALLILLKATTVFAGTASVTVHEVKPPNPAIIGKSAMLECLWDSDEKDFYSVRWYMNGEQFYSFISDNIPEKVDHNLKGINVDIDYSNQTVVTLRDVSLASEGNYRCELMSEAPFFQTSYASTNLTVVNLPKKPEIRDFKRKYRVGDILNVTCVAHESRPAASLTFLINGREIHPESGRVSVVGVMESYHRRGFYTSSSRLTLPLSYRHGELRLLTLTCRADVLNLREESILKAQVDPARSAMLSFFNTGITSCVPTPWPMIFMATFALTPCFYPLW